MSRSEQREMRAFVCPLTHEGLVLQERFTHQLKHGLT